jgi:type IV secretory pathway protease TraF
VAGLIEERHYLPTGFRLLKQVVAVAGDHVCTVGGAYDVNGVSTAPIAAVDTAGRPLPAPYSFCGAVPTGAAWVAGRGATSLDSRFFGPVSLDKLTTAVPLWTTSFSR